MSNGSSTVFIRDMILIMSIGIHAHEKLKRQRVVVNVEIDVDDKNSWQSDNIGTVLSYSDVVSQIQAIAAEGHVNLVETFAEKIAAAVLSFERARRVRIRVEKPDIYDFAAGAGVEIIRSR